MSISAAMSPGFTSRAMTLFMRKRPPAGSIFPLSRPYIMIVVDVVLLLIVVIEVVIVVVVYWYFLVVV